MVYLSSINAIAVTLIGTKHSVFQLLQYHLLGIDEMVNEEITVSLPLYQ